MQRSVRIAFLVVCSFLFLSCSRNLSAELHKAVEDGDMARVKTLLTEGASVNQRDGGLTPLMRAVLKGNYKIVETLLDSGAEPDATSSTGETAMEYATQIGRQDIAILIGARQYLTALDRQNKSLPVSSAPHGHVFKVYKEGSKSIPVAIDVGELQEAEEAVQEGRAQDVLKMIKQGEIFMVPNGSEIELIEKRLRISQIKIKKTGREGYVVNTLIQ